MTVLFVSLILALGIAEISMHLSYKPHFSNITEQKILPKDQVNLWECRGRKIKFHKTNKKDRYTWRFTSCRKHIIDRTNARGIIRRSNELYICL